MKGDSNHGLSISIRFFSRLICNHLNWNWKFFPDESIQILLGTKRVHSFLMTKKIFFLGLKNQHFLSEFFENYNFFLLKTRKFFCLNFGLVKKKVFIFLSKINKLSSKRSKHQKKILMSRWLKYEKNFQNSDKT